VNRCLIQIFVLLVFLHTGAPALLSTSPFKILSQEYQTARRYADTDTFKLPDPISLQVFGELFRECVSLHESGDEREVLRLKPEFNAIGFELSRISGTGRRSYSVIKEKDTIRSGGGFYVLTGAARKVRPVIIQAPHARSDSKTGRISLELFKKLKVNAFFSSTMRRDVAPAPADANPDAVQLMGAGLADPAHNPSHFFQIATEVYLRLHPDSMLIQLHGFAEEPSIPVRNFDVILSCGRVINSERPVHRAMKQIMIKSLKNKKIGVFGKDTLELGALSNIQGNYVNSCTSGFFLHLELSKSYRKLLDTTRGEMNHFIQALKKVTVGYAKY